MAAGGAGSDMLEKRTEVRAEALDLPVAVMAASLVVIALAAARAVSLVEAVWLAAPAVVWADRVVAVGLVAEEDGREVQAVGAVATEVERV